MGILEFVNLKKHQNTTKTRRRRANLNGCSVTS
jgi:hypothetical protein